MNKNISLLSNINRLFGGLFNQKEITEIVINKANSLFFEDQTGFHLASEDILDKITLKNCEQFANALASYSNQSFNSKNPIMGATLPDGERVQIIMPPALDQDQFSITIRKPSFKSFDLKHYKDQGFFEKLENTDNKESSINDQLSLRIKERDYLSFFDLAVKVGKNIVIVGETGSGKTTFMKSLIDSIPESERLITIEDTREIFLKKHSNYVNLLYPQGASSTDPLNATVLLKSSLRMKPDRILVSELRGGETFDYINAVSSGHNGSITSLHAGSVQESFMRLTLMFLQNSTGSRIPYDTVNQIIKNTIDIVAIIKVKNGKRFIGEFYWKDEVNNEN